MKGKIVGNFQHDSDSTSDRALTVIMSSRFNFHKKLSYCWQTARRVQRSVKVTKHGTIPYAKYGFLLVCYSNFILEWTLTRVFEIFDFKNAVTLQTGLGSVRVIENVTIR